MCNASIESFIQTFISFSYTDKLGAIYGDVMTKNMNIWWFTGAFSSLIHRICSKWVVFETTNQSMNVDLQGQGEGQIGIF